MSGMAPDMFQNTENLKSVAALNRVLTVLSQSRHDSNLYNAAEVKFISPYLLCYYPLYLFMNEIKLKCEFFPC